MTITTAVYSFHYDKLYIKARRKVVKETANCYFVKNGRFYKDELNKPAIKSTTSYPYVVVNMLDADEETLRNKLSQWFAEKAVFIKETPGHKASEWEDPEKKFFVYMTSPYGKDLIGTANTYEQAKQIKAEQDAKWEPGFLWSTHISSYEEKEFSHLD